MLLAPAMILVPLLGAIVIGFTPAARAKWIALAASSLAFLLNIVLALQFDHWTDGDFQQLGKLMWLEELQITLNMRADSVSMLLTLLTTLLVPLCVVGSFTAIKDRTREYYVWMMVLMSAMIGVFLASDLAFFYICFEFTLVPMFFLIAIYGSDNRARAATKFFIFTFTGSMITLVGLVYVVWQYRYVGPAGEWSFDIQILTEFARTSLSSHQQALVLLALMCGFAVKVPLFPVHTWLPLAHTEAPTAGSVILAGVLLKLGTYGLYRFVLPMVPEAVVTYAPAIAVLSIIGIIYAGLICWVQDDVKKLVAYSSVSHLGFCVLGLFALNPMGLQGSVIYMLNHGLSTGALFFLIGMMYERYHTRDMNAVGGLAKRMPVWAFFMVFFVLSSVGLPGLNGFVSEFLCLIAAFVASPDAPAFPGVLGPWYAAFAATGMIVAAMYLLIMVGKIVFGPLREPKGAHAGDDDLPTDLGAREILVLAPLAVLCVVIGFRPGILTDAIEQPAEQMLVDAGYPALVEAHVAETAVARTTGEDGPDG